MRIAKEFRWEMGHRLPEHFGQCKNIHGHSYRMLVEVEGDTNESGMVMDYYDIKRVVKPVIELLDHAFMVNENDREVIEFLDKMNSKKVVVAFQSTVENICSYIISQFTPDTFPSNIRSIKVRIAETHDDFAEETLVLR